MSTPQWVNAGPDAGALHALLERVPPHVPVEAIDEVWVFPTRRISEGESTVVVVSAHDEPADHRRVLTFRFLVSRDRRGNASVREFADEHGTAPASAVHRLVDGVLRRLGDDAAQPPAAIPIRGADSAWHEWLRSLGAAPLPD
jgi:hypothetical protein